MDQANEPPDGNHRTDGPSLRVPVLALTPIEKSHGKRKRAQINPSEPSSDVAHEGSPDDELKKRLRSWQVAALRKKLLSLGQPVTGLCKAALVERLATFGTAVTSVPSPLPESLEDSARKTVCPEQQPCLPNAAEAPAEKKTKRGGRREGAGRKKKAPSTSVPTRLQSLSEMIGISPSPATRTQRRTSANSVRQSSCSSLSSPAGSAGSLSYISPAALVIPRHASHETAMPEYDRVSLDFGATPSSETSDYQQIYFYR